MLVAADSLAPVRASGVGAWFLTYSPDARTVALGGAGVALDDLDANTYYNPANVAFGPRFAATWTHARLAFNDESIDHAGLAARLSDRLGIAANVLRMLDAETDVVDQYGHFLGRYRSWDLAAGVSAACRILPNLSAGVTAKGIYSLWAPDWVLRELGLGPGGQALTVAADAGVQYRPQDELTMGFAVANLGPNLRYDSTDGNYLPRVARVGFAVRPPVPGPVSATVTGELSRDLIPPAEWRELYHWDAGLELEFARLACVRLGYLHYERDGSRGLTWGVGLEHRGVRLDVGVDSGIYHWAGSRTVRFQLSGRL
jgi:hypothetical protein